MRCSDSLRADVSTRQRRRQSEGGLTGDRNQYHWNSYRFYLYYDTQLTFAKRKYQNDAGNCQTGAYNVLDALFPAQNIHVYHLTKAD